MNRGASAWVVAGWGEVQRWRAATTRRRPAWGPGLTGGGKIATSRRHNGAGGVVRSRKILLLAT
jgi:hypothetical protein